MAGENDDVLLLSYCHFGFLFPVAGVEKSERYPRPGVAVSSVADPSASSGFSVRNQGSLRAPT